jgi:uncharacterized protein YggU (UPF0235/DUF167 family)
VKSTRVSGPEREAIELSIWVLPRSSRADVGGSRYGSLLVAVPLPPERGRATKAALKLLASAFGVPPSRVELVGGATSREKVVKIYGRHDSLSSRLAELIEGRVELER